MESNTAHVDDILPTTTDSEPQLEGEEKQEDMENNTSTENSQTAILEDEEMMDAAQPVTPEQGDSAQSITPEQDGYAQSEELEPTPPEEMEEGELEVDELELIEREWVCLPQTDEIEEFKVEFHPSVQSKTNISGGSEGILCYKSI